MKFWEMRYGDEPVNGRLFALCFIKKIHIIIISVILGALIVCGWHVGYRLSQEKMYLAETDLHIEYIPAADTNQLIYYNQTTWKQMSYDSAVIDEILKADPSLDAQTVRDCFYADLKSDVKVLTLHVESPDPALSMKITDAAVTGMSAFACSLPEIESVTVIGKASEAAPVPLDIRAFRAVILGAFLGFLISAFALSCIILSDARILLPETIEKRYRIPVAGTLSSDDLSETLEDLAGDDGFIPVSTLTDSKMKDVISALKEKGAKVSDTFLDLSDTEKKGITSEIRKADKPLVYIFSSMLDPKADERALELLSKNDKEPMCAVLIDSDDVLIRNYYFGKRSRFAKKAAK